MDHSVSIRIVFVVVLFCFVLLLFRMKYERMYERVIVLDACYTIKRPTTMFLAKQQQQQQKHFQHTSFIFSFNCRSL